MNTTLLIVLLVAINIFVLAALAVWRIVFRGSFRKMLMTFLGLLVENTTHDHADEPIEMDKSEHKSDIIKQKAEAMSFDAALASAKPDGLQQAIIPPEERGELARDTTDNGWPRELDDETRREPRPFLDVHLRTETVPNVISLEDEVETDAADD